MTRALNFVGGIPDLILRNTPDFTRRQNPASYDEYLSALGFYSPEKWRKKKFFYIPCAVPDFEARRIGPFSEGYVELLRYPSRYKPQNPVMEEEFFRHKTNQTGYVQLWRHDEKVNRPLILCVHGFLMGFPKQAMRMFKIATLFELGLDIGLYIQPHHWKRSDKYPVQYLLSPENLPLTVESFGQNIHDLHSSVVLLRSLGYNRIGAIGASLGGYTLALYATFEAPLDFIFMAVPAISFSHYLSPWRAKFGFRVDSRVEAESAKALELISPLHYRPGYDVGKIGVVIHSGDKLAEAQIARKWIEKWEVKNHVEVTGGHWLYFDSKARGKAWYGWLKKFGYIS